MSDPDETRDESPSENEAGTPAPEVSPDKQPADESETQAAPKQEAAQDGKPVSPEESDAVAEKPKRPRIPKKAIISVAAVAIVAVVGLAVANAMGAFHQHTWADATCTQPRHCIQCGATDGEPLGHDYQEKDVAATCTEGGKRVYTCSRCHDTYSEDDGTPATGHTPGAWTVDSASLKMVQKCQTCGETLDSRDLTRDDVDQALAGQPVTLDSCRKIVNSDVYKALYPDMIYLTVTNHSDKPVKYVNLQVCSWDQNGYPVATKMAYDFSGRDLDSSSLILDDANIVPGASWSSDQKSYGWPLDFNTSNNITTVKGVITSVGYMDDTTWNNPYSDAWLKLHEDKQL